MPGKGKKKMGSDPIFLTPFSIYCGGFRSAVAVVEGLETFEAQEGVTVSDSARISDLGSI